MNDDREHNRRLMPETAALINQARQELAAFGPLKLLYAHENGYEVGIADDAVDVGEIDLDGQRVTVEKTKPRIIGPRAMPVPEKNS